MRPPLFAAEYCACAGKKRSKVLASMRPPLFAAEYQRHLDGARGLAIASMRPPLFAAEYGIKSKIEVET